MAEDLKTAYFRNGAGEVHPVSLPPIDAVTACNKFPWEWSLDGKFADPPEGFVASEGDGRGGIQGASVRTE
jgi:hypothetical protein